MELLILDPDAEDFKRGLESKFSELSIHAGAEEADVADSIETMDILIAKRISDKGMKKALRLQWIQALTTGVDLFTKLPSLRKEVLITSTRGIHGPQMSEMAILHMLSLVRNFPQILRNQEKSVSV